MSKCGYRYLAWAFLLVNLVGMGLTLYGAVMFNGPVMWGAIFGVVVSYLLMTWACKKLADGLRDGSITLD